MGRGFPQKSRSEMAISRTGRGRFQATSRSFFAGAVKASNVKRPLEAVEHVAKKIMAVTHKMMVCVCIFTHCNLFSCWGGHMDIRAGVGSDCAQGGVVMKDVTAWPSHAPYFQSGLDGKQVGGPNSALAFPTSVPSLLGGAHNRRITMLQGHDASDAYEYICTCTQKKIWERFGVGYTKGWERLWFTTEATSKNFLLLSDLDHSVLID